MPQGDKGKYTEKQKRQAEHIAESYEERGVSEDEAESRAWATVNKIDHGGEKRGGGGYGKKDDTSVYKEAGKKGGEAAARRPAAERSRSAKKAAETRAPKAA